MRSLTLASMVFLVVGCGSSTFTPEGDADAGSDPGAETVEEPVGDPGIEPAEDVPPPDLPEEVVEDPIMDVMPDGPCGTTEDCDIGLSCCAGRCVNTSYDPVHCGGCGNVCPNHNRYCDMGECTDPPCDGVTCRDMEFCCGESCCDMEQICCFVEWGGPWGPPECYDDACPGGCPACD